MVKLGPLGRYIISRVIQYIATLFSAFTVVYFLLRAMPTNAVEQFIATITATGQYYDPQAIIEMRKVLYELFGLTGSPIEQYFIFLRRFVTLDFGVAFIPFGVPVRELLMRFLPWTIGLLSITTILSWIIGNILGVIAGFARGSMFSKVLQSVAVVLYPIPYYIMALVLIYLLAYLIPLFPLGTGGSLAPVFSIEFILSLIRQSVLPALSIMIIAIFGWWFLSSRTLTINIMIEDFVVYAEMRGVSTSRLISKYIWRNVLMPQTTALALALGGIFGGALLTEVVFAYPGLGQLMYRAIFSGDYAVALGVLSLTIIGVSTATLIIDLVYPLIDPRVRYRR